MTSRIDDPIPPLHPRGLVAAALAAVASGALLPALVLGGIKAAVVGFEFMELRSAHAAHRIVFALGVAGLVLVLSLVAAHA